MSEALEHSQTISQARYAQQGMLDTVKQSLNLSSISNTNKFFKYISEEVNNY